MKKFFLILFFTLFLFASCKSSSRDKGEIGNDTTPPDTVLFSYPAEVTDIRSATFEFKSTESNSTFFCKLDDGEWEKCVSPVTYEELDLGEHRFQVKAVDSAGNEDPIPAEYNWEIVRTLLTSGWLMVSAYGIGGLYALSPPFSYICAIDIEGHLYCWGNNIYATLGTGDFEDRYLPTQIGSATWIWISLNWDRVCGVQEDSSAWCWGFNGSTLMELGTGSQETYVTFPEKVQGDIKWQMVSTGYRFSCGIDTDSHLYCWGYDGSGRTGVGKYDGETTMPTMVTAPGEPTSLKWKFVDAGSSHACAIDEYDRLWCWGNNDISGGYYGRFGTDSVEKTAWPLLVSNDKWKSVSVDMLYTCGVKMDGSLWCSGYNPRNILGINSGEFFATYFSRVGNEDDWSQVYAGLNHICALKQTGEAYCWGKNYYGETGMNEFYTVFDTPNLISSEISFASLAAGNRLSCGIGKDGSLWCWGPNGWSELGQGVPGNKPAPVQLDEKNWLQVSAGFEYSCGIDNDHALYCWGRNSSGKLGLGNETDYQTPQLVGNGWSYISAGFSHTCGIKSDGSLWCWGAGGGCRLGQDGSVDGKSPLQVGSETDWKIVKTGGEHSCALKEDNTLYCWGNLDYNDLGTDTTDPCYPGRVLEHRDVKFLSFDVSYWHTCGIDTEGDLWCWGRNNYWELGVGDTEYRKYPEKVTYVAEKWVKVSAGWYGTCGITESGKLYCWGYNTSQRFVTYGTLVTRPTLIGDPTVQWEDVVVGYDSICAKRVDNSSWYCQGSNRWGQLGNNFSFSGARLDKLIGGDKFVLVSGNYRNYLALTSDGKRYGWGWNTFGELGDGTSWSVEPAKIEK